MKELKNLLVCILKNILNCDVSLTVHLSIILVFNQFNEQNIVL